MNLGKKILVQHDVQYTIRSSSKHQSKLVRVEMTCGLELNPIPKALGDQKVTAFMPYISGGI